MLVSLLHIARLPSMLTTVGPSDPTEPGIKCSDDAQHSSISGRYRRNDPTWSAAEVIEQVEAARENLRVPFYMYDGMVGGINFTVQTQHLIENCSGFVTTPPGVVSGSQGSPVPAYTKGDVFFIESLLTHPWRVMQPDDAQLIVIPIEVAQFVEHNCGYALPNETTRASHFSDGSNTSGCQYEAKPMMEAVRTSPLYQARAADHVLVSFHWSSGICLQQQPLFADSQAGGLVPYFADALLATAERSEGNGPETSMLVRTDRNIVSPYPPDRLRGDDCRLDTPRPVSFFFGGATQGRQEKHPGYYIRQKLFEDRCVFGTRDARVRGQPRHEAPTECTGCTPSLLFARDAGGGYQPTRWW